MKVAELISQLQTLDPNAVVTVWGGQDELQVVTGVEAINDGTAFIEYEPAEPDRVTRAINESRQ